MRQRVRRLCFPRGKARRAGVAIKNIISVSGFRTSVSRFYVSPHRTPAVSYVNQHKDVREDSRGDYQSPGGDTRNYNWVNAVLCFATPALLALPLGKHSRLTRCRVVILPVSSSHRLAVSSTGRASAVRPSDPGEGQ